MKNFFCKNEGFTFLGEETPSIVGFTRIPDRHGVHNGYKMITTNSSELMKRDKTKVYCVEFTADLCGERHLICIYTNIIQYMLVTLGLRYYGSLIQNHV